MRQRNWDEAKDNKNLVKVSNNSIRPSSSSLSCFLFLLQKRAQVAKISVCEAVAESAITAEPVAD